MKVNLEHKLNSTLKINSDEKKHFIIYLLNNN